MAHIATIKILVNDADEARIADGINDMLRTAQSTVEEGQTPWVVDWTIEQIDPAVDCVCEAVKDGSYKEGQMSNDLMLFSAAEAIASGDGAGFWSNTYGWTTMDLATRFDASCGGMNKPMARRFETVWMRVPVGLSFYVVSLTETDSELDHAGTPIKFECWADNHDHAREQAEDAYKACRIESVFNVSAGEHPHQERQEEPELAP